MQIVFDAGRKAGGCRAGIKERIDAVLRCKRHKVRAVNIATPPPRLICVYCIYLIGFNVFAVDNEARAESRLMRKVIPVESIERTSCDARLLKSFQIINGSWGKAPVWWHILYRETPIATWDSGKAVFPLAPFPVKAIFSRFLMPICLAINESTENREGFSRHLPDIFKNDTYLKRIIPIMNDGELYYWSSDPRPFFYVHSSYCGTCLNASFVEGELTKYDCDKSENYRKGCRNQRGFPHLPFFAVVIALFGMPTLIYRISEFSAAAFALGLIMSAKGLGTCGAYFLSALPPF